MYLQGQPPLSPFARGNVFLIINIKLFYLLNKDDFYLIIIIHFLKYVQILKSKLKQTSNSLSTIPLIKGGKGVVPS